MVGLARNKGYIILLIAQVISRTGDWLSIVAIITLVGLKWNATPMEVSLIFLCLAIPMAVFGPLAGMIADRVSRKGLLIGADLARAGVILLLAITESLLLVYICLIAVGTLSAVSIPAKNGKLKELVADPDLKRAVSISAMVDSSSKVIGPLLSGLFVAAFGAKLVFVLNSATFTISALILFFLPKTRNALYENFNQRKNLSLKTEFFTGFSHMIGNPLLGAGLVFLGSSLVLIQLADSQLIVLIRELPTASPDLFGYLVTASGLGMLLSGLYLTKKLDDSPIRMMLIGGIGLGISFATMAVLTYFDVRLSIVWMPFLGFCAGFSYSFVGVPFHSTVQLGTPVHMTGKVFGVVNSVATTATIIGPLVGGWLSTIIGVIPAFIISASLLVSLSLVGFLTKQKIEEGQQGKTVAKTG